jgi:hypothetical protein
VEQKASAQGPAQPWPLAQGWTGTPQVLTLHMRPTDLILLAVSVMLLLGAAVVFSDII